MEPGFNRAEAESLVSTWAISICPQFLGLLGDITQAIKKDISEGAPMTRQTTRRTFLTMCEIYQDKQFVFGNGIWKWLSIFYQFVMILIFEG